MDIKQIENRMRNPKFAWRVNKLANRFRGSTPTIDEVRERIWERDFIPVCEREEIAQAIHHFIGADA